MLPEPTDREMPMNPRLRPLVWIGLVAALVLGLVGTATAAPVINVTKSTSGQVLAGKDSAVTVQATNAGDQFGFNASVRDVLPAGVSYVPGSADPAVGNPTILANQPAAGQTTLLWVNVADISPASTLSFGYSVSHDPAVLEVGDSYSNTADVYVNTDPRVEPTFSGSGAPSNFTQSGSDSASTDIAPFELTISEPSPEGELLRGLHDHQTVYTLTLENNAVATTTNVGLEAWFPAGLEFLGCATADNTTDAPTNPGSTEEYPGSGAINPGNAPGGFDPAACPSIASVETVSVDPPGPPPAGVYTKVVFSGIADLGIGETRAYQVVAAVPLRENTLTWTTAGGAPTAASGLQASNLDNNSGPSTAEGAGGAEVSLPVAGTLTGDYQGPIGAGSNPFSDDASNTRVAEDLRMRKSVDGGGIAGDRLSDWTLKIDTSEYRFSTGLTVTDTVPDGLCPVGVGLRCPDAGPPPDPYASATEAADGSWTVTWNQTSTPALAQIGPSGTTTITLRTYTRDFYQEDFADDAPILANDSWSNSVALTGTTNNICTGGTGPTDCAGGSEIDGGPSPTAAVSDSSSAGQSAPGPTIDKQIGTPGLAPGADPADRCDPANATYGAGPLNFGPSDLVCYRLTVNFPASVFTGQELGPPAVSPAVELPVADFLPTISGFVAASQRSTAANTVTITDTAGNVDGATDLLWNVSSPAAPAGTVAKGGVFDVTIGAQLDAQPDAAAAGLQLGNLMKYANVNSGGQAFTKRDQVFLTWSSPLEIVKGVALINGNPVGGYPPPQDNKLVEPGDVVTYEIDLTATGGKTAEAVQVWDVLPPQIGCGQVGVISDSGVCNASVTPNRIEWNPASAPPGLSVPPGTPKKLRYDVLIPEGLGSGTNLDNTAGVRQYRETSNTGTPIDFIPSMNIDPSLNPSANTVPIKDPSRVRLVRAKIAKSRTTSVVEPGNSISQATIGERIDYTLTTTVPANTTLFVPGIRDALSARNTYVAGSAKVTLPSGTTISGDAGSAEGWTLSTAGGVILLQNPTSYANSNPTDEIITITFSATVDDEAANVRGGSPVPNATSLTWFVEAGGAKRTKNANVSTPIVEPNVAIAKGNSAAGPLQPGGAVDFTVTASNPSGPSVSVAHDLVVTDVLPSGVTAPTAISGGGLYDAPSRTITWNAGKLDPGASVAFTYSTTVGPSSALSQGLVLQNTATATVTSLAGASPGERTATTAAALGVPGYSATAKSSITVSLPAPAIAKSLQTPPPAEVGQPVTWAVDIGNTASVATAFGVDLIDTLPPNWSYVPGSAGLDGAPLADPIVGGSAVPGVVLTWANLKDLGPGASLRVTFRATPDVAAGSNPGTGTTNPHINSARTTAEDALGASGSSGGPYAAGPATAETILEVPILELDKTPDGLQVDAGDQAVYRITIRNTGVVPARDLVIRDAFPAGVTYTPGTARAGDPDDNTPVAMGEDASGLPNVVWTIPSLAPGDRILISVPVRVNSPQDDGTVLINEASVTSKEIPNEVTDTGELIVSASPEWNTSVKSSLPGPGQPVVPGGTIKYAIGYRNTGDETARDVRILDRIPARTRYKARSATEPGGVQREFTTVASPNVDDDAQWSSTEPADPAAVTAIRWLAGDVSPGTQAIVVRYSVVVDADVPDSTQIVNNAEITSKETDKPITIGPTFETVDEGGGALVAAACIDGGRVVATPRNLKVGVPTRIRIRVTGKGGVAIPNQRVVITDSSGSTRRRSTVTNRQGRATITITARRPGSRFIVSAGNCGTAKRIVAVRTQVCRDIRVTPRSLTVGVRDRIRVSLRSNGRAVRGARVLVRGAGDSDSARTNNKGAAVLTIRPTRTGVVLLRAPEAFRCRVRMGVAAASAGGGALTG